MSDGYIWECDHVFDFRAKELGLGSSQWDRLFDRHRAKERRVQPRWGLGATQDEGGWEAGASGVHSSSDKSFNRMSFCVQA